MLIVTNLWLRAFIHPSIISHSSIILFYLICKLHFKISFHAIVTRHELHFKISFHAIVTRHETLCVVCGSFVYDFVVM